MPHHALHRSPHLGADTFAAPFLTALVQACDDAMFAADGRGVILCWNRAAMRLFGHAADDIVGQQVTRLWPAGRQDEARILVQRLRKGDRLTGIESTYRHKDGQLITCTATFLPVRSARGQTLGFSAVVRDLSGRPGTEQALASESAHLRAILESVGDAILTLDARGTIHTVNPATSFLFGYAAEELIGRPVTLLVASPEGGDHIEQLETALATSQGRIVSLGRPFAGRHRDWTTFPVELAVSTIELRGQRYFTEIVRAVAYRRQADEIRQAFQRRLERVVAANPTIVYVALELMDDRAAVTWVTDNFQALFGYPSEQTYSLVWWLERVHPDERTATADQLRAFLNRGARRGAPPCGGGAGLPEPLVQEYRFQCADGTYRWVRADFRFPDPASHWRQHEVVGHLTDITAIKAGESERAGLNQSLARKNRELQLLLQHAQRLTSLGTLAAGMAHEINNPLTSLRLCLFSIRSSLGRIAEVNEDLRTISEEVERLERIARKYLDYSRSKTQSLQDEAIVTIMDSAASLLSHQARQAGIEVAVSSPAPLPPVRVDAGQIKQVLLNLLSNAIDHLPRGGQVGMTAQLRADEQGKPWVVIEVGDNGGGIPAEDVPYIFEPFFSTKDAGTGLGLFVSRQLAEQNGGRLLLDTTSPAGSAFSLWLVPAVDSVS
jgi:PAS domain S-box-containing protein